MSHWQFAILGRLQETVKIGADVDTIVWDLDGTLLDSFGILS